VPAVRQKLHLSSCADFRDRLYKTQVINGRVITVTPVD